MNRAAREVRSEPFRSADGSHRRGIALISTLFLLVLLSGVLLEAGLRLRVQRLHAINAVDELRARTGAVAGIAHGAAHLEASFASDPSPWGTDVEGGYALGGVPGVLPVGTVEVGRGVTALVEIRDVSSRRSLNHVSREDLERLFRATGSEGDEASATAGRLVEHRDRGSGEAESRPWATPVPRFGHPADAPVPEPYFSVESAARLSGVDVGVLQRAAPYLTVAGSGRVNLNSAPLPVLLSLPGITPETALFILESRAAGRPLGNLFDIQSGVSAPSRQTLQESFSGLMATAVFFSGEWEILSTGAVEGSPVRRSVRALAVTRGPGNGVHIRWTLLEGGA
jgi:type II secretory pathway component PulK